MEQTADKTTDKPVEKPAEAEPKQRPVKRPAKPAYHVPHGIAWLDSKGDQKRIRAGQDAEDGEIPAELITEYLERGAIVALNSN